MLHSKIGLKAEIELTPTTIMVLLSLIMTVVLLILVLGQYLTTNEFLKSYSDISAAKQVVYAFVSVYSTGNYSIMDQSTNTRRYGILDSMKLDDPDMMKKSLLNLKANAKFTVTDLSSEHTRVWDFEYIGLPPQPPANPPINPEDISPSAYEPSIDTEQQKTLESMTIFLPIYDPMTRVITTGMLYVEPY